jgi:hypothetical protein
MLDLIERAHTHDVHMHTPAAGYTGPARVLGNGLLEDDVSVRLADGRSDEPVFARIANPGLGELCAGDTVLVTLGEDGEAYVIGLLSHTRESAPHAASQSLELPGGARVEVAVESKAEGESDEATVRLFTRQGELVLEWDPMTERTRVCVPTGDLEFATERGGIRFDSAEDIRMNARTVSLSGSDRVELGVKDAAGQLVASLRMASRRLRLQGGEVNIDAGRARVQAAELSCTSDTFSAQAKSAKLHVGRLEQIADQVLQRANDVYSTVANLSQLQAGRVRTLVDSTWWMKSKRSYVRSGEDFTLDADKIHLG